MNHSYDPNSKRLRVTIPGDILSTNVEPLRQALTSLLAQDSPDQPWTILEMDLRAARMIDSAGLNLLVFVVRTMEQKSRKLRTLVGNANIRRTFVFTRLDRYLELVADCEDP